MIRLKNNQRGIAHYVLPLIIITLVAIAGAAFVVASHADSVKPIKITSAKIKPDKKKYAAEYKPPIFQGGKGWVCAKGKVGLTYQVRVNQKLPYAGVRHYTTTSDGKIMKSYDARNWSLYAERTVCTGATISDAKIRDGKIHRIKVDLSKVSEQNYAGRDIHVQAFGSRDQTYQLVNAMGDSMPTSSNFAVKNFDSSYIYLEYQGPKVP